MANKMSVNMRTSNGWGNFSLSEQEDGRIKLEDNYFCTEAGEEGFEFDFRYFMEREDYIKGIKELSEKGECSIPVCDKFIWPAGERGQELCEIKMEYSNGNLKINNYKTLWNLEQISIEPINPTNSDDTLDNKLGE